MFVTDAGQSTPINATPYLLRYEDFRQHTPHWAGRSHLVDRLDEVKADLVSHGFDIDAILVGGSFTELAKAEPADVDCLIFYRRREDADTKRLAEIQISAKSQRVDCRLVPIDGDPLMLLKLTSYFSVYYSIGRGRSELVRALLLLD